MLFSRSLSSLLLPALAFVSLSARAASHSRTIPTTAALRLAVKINSNGIKNIVAADRARVQALIQNGGNPSISAADTSPRLYTTEIGVGTPPTYHKLLVDTGSSNTWIGANQSYVKTTTSKDTGSQFSITYGSSNTVVGEEYLDTVTLNSDLVIGNQSIGVASAGYNAGLTGGIDGILGLGPVDSTQGTISNVFEVPTVLDNLYQQKTISSEVFGLFFSPASAGDTTGELTFGGYDSSKITGSVGYVPAIVNGYWGIDQSISYGNTSILSQTSGIIDTGTTTILIPTDAFNKYKAATGAISDDVTGLLQISSDQYDKLSSLYFTIGGVSYELTPNAQIWPRSLNSVISGSTSGIYLVVVDSGSNSGFINGYAFLERFYSVFDTTKSQVGFATTKYTYATTN
ncbi:acid protease [Rhizopogon vinicolor AM-OR11-026]|uniref:Acid protease n=1 Tax=Rhizopogon vinicolor AM-OR11-026 TaxID=1314800 RepID=A0A1B7MI25_9AGAM|nr:acid protease [Rhizopogon vinicolor AM-OR11-026]